ncbi:MAG: hypothetical protein KKA62_04320 [Nanoarchaeota archaeon]|nr:hypothetical protein [Nanoarchaeota archaeon]MBU1977145.1 hypothetical protein [Nanoarchaeota archaeon]
MSECGLTNLAVCLPEKFFEFIISLLNTTIQPLLKLIQTLLTEPANVNTFLPLWAVIVYIISMFYGLFFMFAGFNLMISGYDSAKREKAKYWLRNVVLMIIFVQASFLIYSLVLELSSLMTAGVINIIDQKFFLLTLDNGLNFGLQLSLLIPYIIMLIITIILLGLRYLFAVVGVVFFPFAMFFYFIPPLQSYGKLITNLLLVVIFVPFFDAVLLFGASALLNISVFAGFKIVLTIVAFTAVNLLMIVLMIFAIIKAATSMLDSEVGRGVKKAVKYLA